MPRAFRLSVRRFALLLCLLVATGCAEKSPAGPTTSLNERVTLAPGSAATVRDVGVRVQFVSVTGDSRCPADAVCIWGGDAIVHVRVLASAAGGVDYELHTGDTSRAAVAHGDLRISLAELQPYPFSGRTIRPDDYRATLLVTRP